MARKGQDTEILHGWQDGVGGEDFLRSMVERVAQRPNGFLSLRGQRPEGILHRGYLESRLFVSGTASIHRGGELHTWTFLHESTSTSCHVLPLPHC
jgi:hypothetical protein